MAFTKASIVLVILLFGSTFATRTQLFSGNGQAAMDALAPAAGDGMCKTMVEPKGYGCEEHLVTTKDGFILSMQRIPAGRSGVKPGSRPPVLLQHGLFMDGITWLLLPPDESLAFVLADNGFDVWIANARATKYSSGHTSLSPQNPVFWYWSWDESVAYDLPATFQYVNDQTGGDLHYIGHSQGTLVALAAFSNNQLLNMLRSATLLAPVAYSGQVLSQIVKLAADDFMTNESYWLGLNEFNPTGEAAIALVRDICTKPGVNCTDLITSFTGPNCCLNSSLLLDIVNHGPQSTSTKNLIHLSQMLKQGTIAMYDYENGDENTKHYGQPTPPVYNMTNIPNDVPLFVSYGGADAISDVKDVQLLLDSLKDHVKEKLVVHYVENYAHADFVIGVTAKQVVYDPLMAFLKLQ